MNVYKEVIRLVSDVSNMTDLELQLLLHPLWNGDYTRLYYPFNQFSQDHFRLMYEAVKTELENRGIQVAVNPEVAGSADVNTEATAVNTEATDVNTEAENPESDKAVADKAVAEKAAADKAEDDDNEADKADEDDVEDVDEERSKNRSLRVPRHPNSPRPSNTTFLLGPVRMSSKRLRVILINLDIGYVCFPEVYEDLGEGKKVYKVSIGLKDQTVANLYNRHTAVRMLTGENKSIPVKLF